MNGSIFHYSEQNWYQDVYIYTPLNKSSIDPSGIKRFAFPFNCRQLYDRSRAKEIKDNERKKAGRGFKVGRRIARPAIGELRKNASRRSPPTVERDKRAEKETDICFEFAVSLSEIAR